MKIFGSARSSAWEWVVILGLTGASIAITGSVGLAQKWQDGIIYTVALFAVIISSMRPAWNLPGFFRNLLLLFLLHLVVMVAFLSVLQVGRFGIPKLIWTMALIGEGVLFSAVLWRKTNLPRR